MSTSEGLPRWTCQHCGTSHHGPMAIGERMAEWYISNALPVCSVCDLQTVTKAWRDWAYHEATGRSWEPAKP